jgi:hypothetical protein
MSKRNQQPNPSYSYDGFTSDENFVNRAEKARETKKRRVKQRQLNRKSTRDVTTSPQNFAHETIDVADEHVDMNEIQERSPQQPILTQQPPNSVLHQQTCNHSMCHQQSFQQHVNHQPPLQQHAFYQPPLQQQAFHQPPLQHQVFHQPPLQHQVFHQPSLQQQPHQLPIQPVTTEQPPQNIDQPLLFDFSNIDQDELHRSLTEMLANFPPSPPPSYDPSSIDVNNISGFQHIQPVPIQTNRNLNNLMQIMFRDTMDRNNHHNNMISHMNAIITQTRNVSNEVSRLIVNQNMLQQNLNTIITFLFHNF